MIKHRDYIIKKIKGDEVFALEYLRAALEAYQEDGNEESFLLALATLIKAKDGFSKIARKAGKGRESLYKSLSKSGNPQFDTISKIVGGLGYRLNIERTEILHHP